MVEFKICWNTRQWSRYTDFYIEHRQRIIPGYRLSHALTDVRICMKQGRAALLNDERGRVIGIGGFVLGTHENQYRDKQIAVLGNSYFLEDYHNNRTFVRGLQVLAEQIREANPDVREVRIPTAADNPYTNRLYRKLAEKHHSFDTEYGVFHMYATSYRDFADFCDRFRGDPLLNAN